MPERYNDTAVAAALFSMLDHATRMIIRHIGRALLRSLMTMGGVSLSVATPAISLQWYEIVDRLTMSHFADSQRQNISIGFFDSKPMKAKNALGKLPGILTGQTDGDVIVRYPNDQIETGTLLVQR